jgi:Gametolysin peptidase M11
MVQILPLSLLLLRFCERLSWLLQGDVEVRYNSSEKWNDPHLEEWTDYERNLSLLEKKKLQRIQESRVGIKHLLAIRVSSTLQETPMESLDEMEAAIFGTGPNPLHVPSDGTLVAQFEAVSHGKLRFAPWDDPALTRPGLLDIVISTSTMKVSNDSSTNRFDSIVRPALISETVRRLGHTFYDVADHVLFCMPNGSLDGTVAGIGEVGGMFTYFHLGYCRKLDALMHEVGHNLHFHHSGIGSHEYGDMTDYMGGLESAPRIPASPKRHGSLKGKSTAAMAIDGAGYPKKAFNGHKHWTSGWFRDRTLEIFPLESNCTFHQRLVSFVDYGNAAMDTNDFVLLRVSSLYIQYNRAKGYNGDTSEPDHVTVTEGFEDGGISVRIASLAEGEEFVIHNFDSSGKSLVIQVCIVTREKTGSLDFADIILYIDRDNGPVPCSSDQNVQCPRKAGSVWDRMLLQISEPVRSILFYALLIGIVIAIFCFSLICCVFFRYFFIDRTNAKVVSSGIKGDDSTVSA